MQDVPVLSIWNVEDFNECKIAVLTVIPLICKFEANFCYSSLRYLKTVQSIHTTLLLAQPKKCLHFAWKSTSTSIHISHSKMLSNLRAR